MNWIMLPTKDVHIHYDCFPEYQANFVPSYQSMPRTSNVCRELVIYILDSSELCSFASEKHRFRNCGDKNAHRRAQFPFLNVKILQNFFCSEH